jgi:CRP-like cAMP-binding protein
MTQRFDPRAAIKRLVPINRLSAETQAELVELCIITTYQDGEVIFTQGFEDEFVHYLLDGQAELLWNGNVVKNLRSGSKAAYRALDPPGPKRHTVRAVEHCTIGRFAREEIQSRAAEVHFGGPTRELEVSEIATQQSSNWMIRMLQSELFGTLPATNIQKIFARMEEIQANADEVIVRQGEPGDHYYVVEEGYCEVTRHIAGGNDIHLADLRPGDAFGETALIAGGERNASVTMLSDGRLMRLHKDDFNELIRQPLLQEISVDTAIKLVEAGAVWVDIRYPEEHAENALRESLNMPLSVLRIQAQRLDPKTRYIVCGADPAQNAVAAFLLVERGFDVKYIVDTVAEALVQHPSLSAKAHKLDPTTDKVVTFPTRARRAARMPGSASSEDSDMEEKDKSRNLLESTIDKIDRIYAEKESEVDARPKVPTVDYTDTATGQRLADLIDEMDKQQAEQPLEDLAKRTRLPVSPAEILDIAPTDPDRLSQTSNVLLVDTQTPLPVTETFDLDTIDEEYAVDEDLAQVFQDFEYRIRDYVESVSLRKSADVERRYQDKMKRLRKAAAVEIRKREAAAKQRYGQHYKKKELVLRKHYKKLMALANKITKQKADLQQARKQFEEKLSAANSLYKQVEEMRKLLAQNMGMPPAIQKTSSRTGSSAS